MNRRLLLMLFALTCVVNRVFAQQPPQTSEAIIIEQWEHAPATALRRRYGAVETPQEFVAQEVERTMGVSTELDYLAWRRSQPPMWGGYGPGFWGPWFGWPGFWRPGVWGPGFGGWRGPVGYGWPGGAPAIAPWGPNTVTGYGDSPGGFYW